jgi:hypothetical protein
MNKIEDVKAGRLKVDYGTRESRTPRMLQGLWGGVVEVYLQGKPR